MTPDPRTVTDMVLALEGRVDCGVRFVSRKGKAEFHTYDEVVRRVRRAAGVFQSLGIRQGDRVALVLPTSIRFLDAFLGAQFAGGIPVALYPPFQLGKLDEYFKRTQLMLERVGARFLVTDWRIRKILGPAVRGVESLEHVLDVEKLDQGEDGEPVSPSLSSPAFLQFSSGTTSEPKAIQVSHENLHYNLAMIDSFFEEYGPEDAEAGGVCWLPLYHDMGLVGCMYQGLFHPGTLTYMGPENFLAKPALWLQTMSRYKAVISPAPNFAYGYCVQKIKDAEMEGVDLSSWAIALNGAEPINPIAMDAFAQRFSAWGFQAKAMTPAYGLAEAVLAVTISDLDAAPVVTEFDRELLPAEGRAVAGTGRRIPSVGKPVPWVTIEVRNQEGQPVPEGQVGAIFVQGPSITDGYYENPEATQETFIDGWLDTGDLGFFYEENLYICGRRKDLIIIRGRNYSPHEIEEVLSGIEGLRAGCAVAVSAWTEDKGEQLVLLAERDPAQTVPEEDLVKTITERVLAGTGLLPYAVRVLETGTLPRTSSGKLRRIEAARMFSTENLAAPKAGTLTLLGKLAKSQFDWLRFRLERSRSKRD